MISTIFKNLQKQRVLEVLFCLLAMQFPNLASATIKCNELTLNSNRILIDADTESCGLASNSEWPTNRFRLGRYSLAPDDGDINISLGKPKC